MPKEFSVPNRNASREVALAAVIGEKACVILQDEQGNQVMLTPKLARRVAKRLAEFANIAEGQVEPDLSRGIVLPLEPTMVL